MIKPTTIMLGEKANKLLKALAAENGIASRYFFTKIITREARAEVATLVADKMKERVALINEVEDELVEIINNPPQEQMADRDFSHKPKSIYAKIWAAHKRLAERGMEEEEIHEYCLSRYGMDIDIKATPSRTPKNNPNWAGGGIHSKKYKQANKVSIEIKEAE